MRVLIIGCGYIGTELGRVLSNSGHEVFGIRRTPQSAEFLRQFGITPLAGDISDPTFLESLPSAWDWVVNTVASGGGTAEDYRCVYLEGTRNLIRWLAANPPKRFVYTSSTSVYGQNDGSLVTEESTTEPQAETSRILIKTEQLLLSSGLPAVVLRLAGIYGPGRGYWFKQFLSGEARLDADGERWLNMIHRDDVIGAIIAALQTPAPSRLYNVVDDEPVTQKALFTFLAEHFQKPMPLPQQAESLRPGKRGVTNKRVASTRFRTELHYRFKYPSFRDAVRAEAIFEDGYGKAVRP